MTVEDCTLHPTAIIFAPHLVNLYGCTLGAHTTVGPFVEIQRGVTVGADCKISTHSFLCSGVTLGNRVFVGHGVIFTNDRYPAVSNGRGMLQTVIEDDVSIGSGAVLLPVRVGRGAMIGAGAVVTHDVLPGVIMVGNPARSLGHV